MSGLERAKQVMESLISGAKLGNICLDSEIEYIFYDKEADVLKDNTGKVFGKDNLEFLFLNGWYCCD